MNQPNAVTPPETNPQTEAWKAALLSALIIPGAGQLFNQQWIKGFFVLFIFLISSLGVLLPITIGLVRYTTASLQGSMDEANAVVATLMAYWISMLILTLVSIVLYVYSIIDSFQTRKKMSQNRSEYNGKS